MYVFLFIALYILYMSVCFSVKIFCEDLNVHTPSIETNPLFSIQNKGKGGLHVHSFVLFLFVCLFFLIKTVLHLRFGRALDMFKCASQVCHQSQRDFCCKEISPGKKDIPICVFTIQTLFVY